MPSDRPIRFSDSEFGECCSQFTYAGHHLGIETDEPAFLPTAVRNRVLMRAANIRNALREGRTVPEYELDTDMVEDDYDSYDPYAPGPTPYAADYVPPNSMIADYVDGSGICSYSFKPRWQFHGDGPTFLGMEVELESDDGMLRRGAMVVNEALGFGDLGFIKSDGSINYGFEIVTQPMSFDWAQSCFPWDMFTKLQRLGFRGDDTCGIHVHVNRSTFESVSHRYRWLAFLYRNPRPIQRLARRGSVGYSSWDNGMRENILVSARTEGETHGQRYSIVNVQNEDTFEVRMFQGSADPNEIRASAGLVDASVEYARQVTAADIARNDGWSFAAFKEWCKGTDRWPDLTASMEAQLRNVPLAQSVRPADKNKRYRSRPPALPLEPRPSYAGDYTGQESRTGRWYWCSDCYAWHANF